MATLKFESDIHYFNVCNKFLKRRGIFLNEEQIVKLRIVTDYLYNFSNEHQTTIKRLELRDLNNIFTYKLNEVSDINSLNAVIKELREVADFYRKLFNNEHLEKSDKEKMMELCFRPQAYRGMYYYETQRQIEFSENFIDEQRNLIDMRGIYFLYDEDDVLIYIGKSTRNLGSRIGSSARERRAKKYRYAILENESDTNIYELYYIALYKPPLNRDCVTEDTPTIKLPELSFSEMKEVFD